MSSYHNCTLISEAKTPPSFPKKITSLQQTEGQPVRFECRIAGSSPIEVSWLKDGEPLKEGGDFSMLYDDNTAVLQIERGEMRHSGEYTCVATNSVGSTSCRAKLTLQGLSFGPDCGRTCGPCGHVRSHVVKQSWILMGLFKVPHLLLLCRTQIPSSL